MFPEYREKKQKNKLQLESSMGLCEVRYMYIEKIFIGK